MSVHVPSEKQYIILLLIRRLSNVVMVIATWFKLDTVASSLNLPCHCGTICAAIAGTTSTRQTWLSVSTFHVSFDVT
jgi:type III secretory pathway component EscU